MKKKRAPNKKRTTFRSRLGDVEEKLDNVLRRHADDIVTIGGLLEEAKDMIGRGRWLPWLKDRFSMSERSAQRYMKASAFAKSVTVTDFRKCNLSPGALYLLSEDRHWKQRGGIVDDSRRIATEAVLKEASQKRVGEDRAVEIIEKALADMAAAEEADRAKRLDWEAENPERAKQKAREEAIRYAMESDMDDAKQLARKDGKRWSDVKDEWVEEWLADFWGEEQEAEFEAKWKERWARVHGPAEQAETAKDTPLHEPHPEPEGEPENDPEEPPPPPPPPPPGPLPRDKYLAEKFAAAILELVKLTTKSSAKFAGVIPADDLELIANFLNQIAAHTKTRAA
jgi:hypothetical protein